LSTQLWHRTFIEGRELPVEGFGTGVH
jgi:hypothetical protein